MGAQPSVTCNHFVPQFATRAWLLGLDHFYQLSRQEGQVRVERAGPRSFGSEDQLYSQQIELAFGAIENRVAPIQRKLERGEPLSLDERHAWAMWLLAS